MALYLFALGAALSCFTVLWALVERDRRRSERERASLEHVALLSGGKVGSDGALELFIDGDRARLTYGGLVDPGYTRLEVDCSPEGRLHLWAAGGMERVGRWWGAEDLGRGDPRFDGFIVQGGPTEWVASAFGEATRARLHALTEACAGLASVSVTRAGVRLDFSRNLVRGGDRFALLRSLDAMIAVVRAIRGPLDPAAPRIVVKELLAEGRCPVCTDAIGADPERCPRCDTAHHRDCFEFLGGCAVFACDARRARAQARQPAKGW